MHEGLHITKPKKPKRRKKQTASTQRPVILAISKTWQRKPIISIMCAVM